MREYSEEEEIDFAIVGTGAGGGTLACRLAEAGFSVVAFDAGPYWRPLEDFTSDETEQAKLYRSEEHTSELQSLMRISYAVFCLKKKKKTQHHYIHTTRKQSRTIST